MGLFGNKPKQLTGQQAQVAQANANGGVTKGTIERSACPWCMAVFSFKDEQDCLLEPGHEFQCDSAACRRYFVVAQMKPVTLVWLKRIGQPSGFGT